MPRSSLCATHALWTSGYFPPRSRLHERLRESWFPWMDWTIRCQRARRKIPGEQANRGDIGGWRTCRVNVVCSRGVCGRFRMSKLAQTSENSTLATITRTLRITAWTEAPADVQPACRCPLRCLVGSRRNVLLPISGLTMSDTVRYNRIMSMSPTSRAVLRQLALPWR